MPPASSRTCVFCHESLTHAGEALHPVVVFLAFAFSCFFWALLQLPLDPALDCHGPQCTLFVRLSLAVAGRAAFVPTPNLQGLPEARMLSAQVTPPAAGFFRGDHQGADNHP